MLKELYGTKAQYLTEFADATRQAVAAGYVLAADQAGAPGSRRSR